MTEVPPPVDAKQAFEQLLTQWEDIMWRAGTQRDVGKREKALVLVYEESGATTFAVFINGQRFLPGEGGTTSGYDIHKLHFLANDAAAVYARAGKQPLMAVQNCTKAIQVSEQDAQSIMDLYPKLPSQFPPTADRVEEIVTG